jgi:hypothetical protein
VGGSSPPNPPPQSLLIPDRQSAAGMVMRARPVQRIPEAKLPGAAMGGYSPKRACSVRRTRLSPILVPSIAVSPEPFGGRIRGPVRLSYTPASVSNDQEHHLRIPDRRSAAGMVMRAAKPVQRIPEAKLLGAAMGFAEPHGHVGRQHRRCDEDHTTDVVARAPGTS